MNVYLVEDVKNNPGRIYAIFAHEEDADKFSDSINGYDTIETEVVERTLFHGQPNNLGFNK